MLFIVSLAYCTNLLLAKNIGQAIWKAPENVKFEVFLCIVNDSWLIKQQWKL